MKDLIYSILKFADRPVKRPELLSNIFVKFSQVTDRTMRKSIEEMITVDGYLIASSEKGYHLIQTEKDLTAAMEYLDSKASSIAIRKNCLLRNYRNKFKSEPVCQPLLFK